MENRAYEDKRYYVSGEINIQGFSRRFRFSYDGYPHNEQGIVSFFSEIGKHLACGYGAIKQDEAHRSKRKNARKNKR